MTATTFYRSARRRVLRSAFERGRLEDTYGVVSLEELDVAHPDRRHYEPSGWKHLSRALRGRPIAPGDVFLDYGSGKGRIVQQAAQLPFARVLGIEISEELTAVARRNIDNNRESLVCGDVTLECCDVADFAVPDDVTHAYLYNSFVGPTFSAALDELVRSHDRRPRWMTLFYVHPLMADVLAAHPRFALEQVVGRRRRIDRRLHVYGVLPSDETTP
jgi:hypothetical protein